MKRVYQKQFESIATGCTMTFDPEVFKDNPVSSLQVQWQPERPCSSKMAAIFKEYFDFKAMVYQDCVDNMEIDGELPAMIDGTQFDGMLYTILYQKGKPPTKFPPITMAEFEKNGAKFIEDINKNRKNRA
jgi:hypothetical protein